MDRRLVHLLCEDRLRELGVVQPGEGSEEALLWLFHVSRGQVIYLEAWWWETGAASLRPLQGQHQWLHLLVETKSSSPGWVGVSAAEGPCCVSVVLGVCQ